MFDSILKFFKKFSKEKNNDSKDTAKERLHLVLMQDRANVSADFLELMKQEIIEVIKKYIDVDENLIDVKLTNKINNDGTTGAPALYANIPIVSIKDETRKISIDKQEADQHKKDTKNQNENNEQIKNNKENQSKEQAKNEKQAQNEEQVKTEKQPKDAEQVKSEKQTQNEEQAKDEKNENVKESKSKEDQENSKNTKNETKQKEKSTKAS